MANTVAKASGSAMVLEPKSFHTLEIGRAMREVVAPLVSTQSCKSSAYGVLIWDQPKPEPNLLVAVDVFLKAYRKALNVLSHGSVHVEEKPATELQTIMDENFADVHFFVGSASERILEERVKPSPGVYIMTSHLNSGLLQSLDLPPLPQRFRNLPMVMQVESVLDPSVMELPRLADPDEEVDRDTIQWRESFLRSYPYLTSAQISAQSSRAKNKAAIASRWVGEKKIFAVRNRGQQLFPRFQFQDGLPLPVIAKVIKIFPEHASGWDLAYFFTTTNPYIEGRKPIDLLKSNPDRVVSLADAFAHPANVF